jgi:capsular exopolysaccharide synthesis family protein
MREVDEALKRAFQERNHGELCEHVPPAPHWPVNHRQGPDRSADIVAPSLSLGLSRPAELEWPALVLTLEREWGERFQRMGELLLGSRQRQNLKVILFTSCHRAEGRTTLVLALARALSRQPVRTLVVDADLTGPMVARLLGLRPEVGLDDVVEHGQALTDALINAPHDHLAVLPMRSAVRRPRSFLASPAWTCTLARLRREYDLVLLDGGPLFIGLSAAVFHRSVDAAVLVHHRETTGQRAVLRAREMLEASGIPLLGLAETFV